MNGTRSGPQTRLATGALVPAHLLPGGAMNAKARAVHKRGNLENMVSASRCHDCGWDVAFNMCMLVQLDCCGAAVLPASRLYSKMTPP
jgi:hypothetical protein